MKKILSCLTLVSILAFSCSKKEDTTDPTDSNNNNNNTTSGGTLVIQNGGLIVAPGQSLPYEAVVISASGVVSPATGVTWSSSQSSVATVNGSIVTATGSGETKITASVSYNGSTLSASVPLGVYMPSVFAVLPGIISYQVNETPIQLMSVYVGSGNPGTYTYTSSNSAVASVSSSGLVSFPGTGEAVITVTAPGLEGSPSVLVPVLVWGKPSSTLPVTKVVISPNVKDIFIDEEFTFTAKAYNSAGNEVSSSGIVWSLSNDTVASIDNNGKVKGLFAGNTTVKAVVNGILGTADLQVVPKKVIEVTPYVANIAPSKTRQFTAKTYDVSRNGSTYALTLTGNPSDLKWEIPATGISMFDIATVDNNGLVTMKSSAQMGMATVVTAYSPSDHKIDGSAAIIMVSNCDCGPGTGVTQINTDKNTYTLSLMSGPVQIMATTVPSGETVNFCSDSPTVVSVDPSGMMSPTGPGTTTVTICNGNVIKTVTVNVTF